MGMRSASRATERPSYARHLEVDHGLPGPAVEAMGDRGADLREFHGQEHENDVALGLGRYPRRAGA
jgi:hypothetical protein